MLLLDMHCMLCKGHLRFPKSKEVFECITEGHILKTKNNE